MKSYTFIILFISFFFLTNCGNDKNKGDNDSNNDTVSSKTLDKFETKAFIDKYNVYIDFGNNFDSRVVSSYDRYFGWADQEKGPSADSKYIRGVYTLNDHHLEKLEKAITQEPEIEEVDDLMKPVLKDATKLYNILLKANSYYEKQDYKDDNFATGQELHKELIAAYNNYFNSYGTMYNSFKNVQNELKEFEANKYKEAGLHIKYNMLMELNKAGQVLNIIGGLDGKELKKLDLEAFKDASAKFRTYHDALEGYNNDEAQKTKEFGEVSIAKSFLSSFISAGNKFIKECRNLEERIEKNDFKYSIVHPGIPDKGSPDKINEIYGDLIENYNRMN